jgi:cytochrome c
MRIPISAAILALAVSCALPAAAAGDPAAGERVFKTQCGACHSPFAGKNLVGPSLHAIFGRHSGSIEGFRYSAANKSANLVWDEATLDKYLTNPKAIVPGTTMTFAGIKNDAQRADLIAYLKTVN